MIFKTEVRAKPEQHFIGKTLSKTVEIFGKALFKHLFWHIQESDKYFRNGFLVRMLNEIFKHFWVAVDIGKDFFGFISYQNLE